jgi:hypothetical protein
LRHTWAAYRNSDRPAIGQAAGTSGGESGLDDQPTAGLGPAYMLTREKHIESPIVGLRGE